MTTTCAMIMESLTAMKQHLYQAHNMQPDFHITITQECRADLFNDPNVRDYIEYSSDWPDKLCGHSFSIYNNQDLPYRIWIAGKLQ